jgi:hypothetical protein
MNSVRVISYLTAGAVILTGPATSFAAAATKMAAPATTAKVSAPAATTTSPESDVTSEDILNVLEEMPAPAPAMMDGRGGANMSIMYPPYGGGGVQVDASITKEITPDFIALNAYCDSGRGGTREEAKKELNDIYNAIKTAVGKDGRVRKQGSISIYPYYGPTGEESGKYSANLSVMIRILNTQATQRISDAVENLGCSVNWDVRLVDTQSFEMDVLEDLSKRLNKRKAVFEKLLGKKLTTVVSASLYTWVDGYASYDPETNKADATTTLSVSFGLTTNTRIPATAPAATRRAVPKG